MAICKYCGKEFEVNPNYHRKNFPPTCCGSKECKKKRTQIFNKEYVPKYWRTHPDMYKINQLANAKRVHKMRAICLVHYSGGIPPKCACCGEEEIIFLTIDHINGNGRKHRQEKVVSHGGDFYRWLIVNKFPEGFQVLCWNCNMTKRNYPKRFCRVHHPELY